MRRSFSNAQRAIKRVAAHALRAGQPADQGAVRILGGPARSGKIIEDAGVGPRQFRPRPIPGWRIGLLPKMATRHHASRCRWPHGKITASLWSWPDITASSHRTLTQYPHDNLPCENVQFTHETAGETGGKTTKDPRIRTCPGRPRRNAFVPFVPFVVDSSRGPGAGRRKAEGGRRKVPQPHIGMRWPVRPRMSPRIRRVRHAPCRAFPAPSCGGLPQQN